MKKNKFGNTGFNVSRIGVGLAEIGYELDHKELDVASKLLNSAIDNGINFLDTAACYGISEELIGKSVSRRREEYFLATKAGHSQNTKYKDWSYNAIKSSIEDSLRKLQTEYVDLVQLHSCGIDVLEKGEVITAIQDAKQEGKTRFIGYSGDNKDAHWAVDSGLFSTLQTSYNIAEQRARSTKLLDKAAKAKLGIIIKRPIAGSAWAKAKHKNNQLRAYDNTYLERSIKMQSLGSVKGEHSDGILTSIAFTLSNPHISVAIIGTKNPNHLLSNINIVNSLEPLDQSTLNELYNRFDQLDDNWKQLT